MLHLALAGVYNPMSLLQDSGDEDQAQERVNKLAKALCCVSMVTGQNSLKISALHLVISLRLFSSKVVVKIHP
jgi:acetyl-CoA carboxylase/biotin carboxylase 1